MGSFEMICPHRYEMGQSERYVTNCEDRIACAWSSPYNFGYVFRYTQKVRNPLGYIKMESWHVFVLDGLCASVWNRQVQTVRADLSCHVHRRFLHLLPWFPFFRPREQIFCIAVANTRAQIGGLADFLLDHPESVRKSTLYLPCRVAYLVDTHSCPIDFGSLGCGSKYFA